MATSHRQELELNEQQQRIYDCLEDCFEQERRRVAILLAGKDDSSLLGQTEFDLRDRVHDLGAKALEVVADERQKKGRIRKS